MRVLDSFGRTRKWLWSTLVDEWIGWVLFSVKLCVYLHILRICYTKLLDSENGWGRGGGGEEKNKG